MKIRKLLVRLGTLFVAVTAALASTSPAVIEAAAPAIVVDADNPATDCGKYNGKAAVADAGAAIDGAASGSTVVICPGDYSLGGTPITIANKTLTIMRAVTGPGSRPYLNISFAAPIGINIGDATVTIDGLILDGSANSVTQFKVIEAAGSTLTIKNSTILGSNSSASGVIFSHALGSPKARGLTITNSMIAGYRSFGVWAAGGIKVNISSSHIDGSDGGRVDSSGAIAVNLDGTVAGLSPTGTVSKSRIISNMFGVRILESSNVSVSGNTLIDNEFSVWIGTAGYFHGADNNKITGNTILGIPSMRYGIIIENTAGASPSMTIRKFTISKNVIVADQYGGTAVGVYVTANMPQPPGDITGSISGNTFVGMEDHVSINGTYPMVVETGSDVQP